jgi:hypothetical protein
MRPARTALLLITVLTALAGAGAMAALRVDRVEAERSERAALDARYAQALELFRAQRYAAAYGRLMVLADAGHLLSAQAALLMLRNGKAMFGSQWSATERQQMRWNATVVNGARERMAFVAVGGADD